MKAGILEEIFQGTAPAAAEIRKIRMRYRTREIRAGNQLEIEMYPIWETGADRARAREALEKTRAAQREINARNRRKRLTRLANQNFGETDMHVVLTYRGDAPDEEQAGRDVRNYLRRVRRWRRARGMPDIKYIYVTECTGKNGETKRIHHHIMMSGMPRDEAEALWRMGLANARRLQPDERGLEALICYMVKAKKCRAQTSRNLMPPVERVRDIRLGWRKAARIAEAMEAGGAQAAWERMYPAYRFVGMEIRGSEFVPGAYMYATLTRKWPAGAGTQRRMRAGAGI